MRILTQSEYLQSVLPPFSKAECCSRKRHKAGCVIPQLDSFLCFCVSNLYIAMTRSSVNTLVASAVWVVAFITFTQPIPIIGMSPTKWTITEPNVTYDEWTDIFTMKYGLDSSINFTQNLRSDILIKNCTYPKLGVNDGIVSNIVNGTGYNVFEVDPYTMSQDPRLFNYGEWANSTATNPQPKAEIDICVRASLWTGPESNPSAVETATFETIVTLHIDLTDDPRLNDFNTNKKDATQGKGNTIEEDQFEVLAYFCDPTTQLLATDVLPVNQGQLVTICVEAGPLALSKGIYIDYIDSFRWVRDYSFFNVTQEVISNATLVTPEVSFYDCVPPLRTCDFSMFMFGDFFLRPGNAYGLGVAYLTFGGPAIPLPENYTSTNDSTRARIRFLQDGPPQQQHHTASIRANSKHQSQSKLLELLPYQQQQQQQQQQQRRQQQQQQNSNGFELTLDLSPADDRPRPALKTAGGEGSSRRPWKRFFALTSHLILLGSVFWMGLGLDW